MRSEIQNQFVKDVQDAMIRCGCSHYDAVTKVVHRSWQIFSSPSSEAGAVKPVPAFIKALPPENFGKCWTEERKADGGIRKTITPEALKEKLKLFTGEKK